MIISKIQEPYIHHFEINHLVVSSKFLQENHIILKTFNSEFEAIEVWFTDQNS